MVALSGALLNSSFGDLTRGAPVIVPGATGLASAAAQLAQQEFQGRQNAADRKSQMALLEKELRYRENRDKLARGLPTNKRDKFALLFQAGVPQALEEALFPSSRKAGDVFLTKELGQMLNETPNALATAQDALTYANNYQNLTDSLGAGVGKAFLASEAEKLFQTVSPFGTAFPSLNRGSA